MGFVLKQDEEQSEKENLNITEADAKKDGDNSNNNKEDKKTSKLSENEKKQKISELNFNYNLYKKQEQGIAGKLKNYIEKTVIYTICSVLLFAASFKIAFAPSGMGLGFYNVIAGIFGIFFSARGARVAVFNGFSYMIHSEKKLTQKFLMKYCYRTLLAEQRFCKQKMREIYGQISELEENGETSIPLIEYTELRADTNVLDFFYDNKAIFVTVIGIIIGGSSLYLIVSYLDLLGLG